MGTYPYNLLAAIKGLAERDNCKRIGDLVHLDEDEIRRMRQLGKVTANEIAQALKSLGIERSAWDEHLL